MKKPILVGIAYFSFFLVMCLIIKIFESHMEAKAYQNVTGVKVSTWDAMWIELRVQTGPGTQEK